MLPRRSINYPQNVVSSSNICDNSRKSNKGVFFLRSLSFTECMSKAKRCVSRQQFIRGKFDEPYVGLDKMANVVHVLPYDDFPSDTTEVPKYSEVWEENRSSLKSSLSPILWCMRLSGLLHAVRLGKSCQKTEVSELTSKKCSSPLLIYTLFTLALLWTNVALAMLPFQYATGFDGYVCNQIITATWFLQVACIALNNAIGCRHWEGIFKTWDQCAKNVDLDTRKLIHRSCIVATIIYVLWIIIQFIFTGLGSFLLTGRIAGSGMFNEGESLDTFILVLFWVIFFYFSSSWYLLTAVFCIMAVGIYKAFQTFYTRLHLAFVDGKFRGDIGKHRLYHDGLIRLLAAVDNMFSMYILMAIGTIIPLIILTLYFVLFESIDTFSYVATWWSVSLSFIQMMAIFIGGGLVNHMAHCPLETLYRIDLAALTTRECHQVSVFLNQLSSHPIGFTAFGLFTVDKPTIITLSLSVSYRKKASHKNILMFAGSIVTYAVVVIQFKPSDSSTAASSVVCNCSCT